MASTVVEVSPGGTLPRRETSLLRRLATRLLTPSLSDCFLLSVMVWLFVAGTGGWTALLLDGDCGWHIRTGDLILATGSVPRTDPFSFTRLGEAWFAWEWLSDVLFAVLHQAIGLKGVVLLAGVLISSFATLLLRHAVWAGANMFAALAVTLLAVGASSVHFLARPHLFTLVLFAAAMWLLDRDRRVGGYAVWLLVPLTVLWTNLHGGFLALVASLGLLTLGAAGETLLKSQAAPGWSGVRRYALLTASCLAASAMNPYGINLHKHVWAYLHSEWIRNVVQEFQSPNFRTENLQQFEILVFAGLLVSGRLAARKRLVEPLWLLFWTHSALGSVRHAPLYAIVAVPVLAVELTRHWKGIATRAPKNSVCAILDAVMKERSAAFCRISLWPVLAVAVLVSVNEPLKWPRAFPAQKFPIRMTDRYAPLLAGSRVFTTDQWADYLIYRLYPKQRVFIDGRSDFFGEQLGREYVAIRDGRFDWLQLLEKRRVEVVLAPVENPIASLLKQRSGWTLVHDDGQAALFELRRIPNAATAR